MNKSISLEKRFKFGENWYRFIAHMNEARISSAKESLSGMLSLPDLKRKSFLDIDYYLSHDFVLQKLRTCGGRIGCNEFVFRRLMNQ